MPGQRVLCPGMGPRALPHPCLFPSSRFPISSGGQLWPCLQRGDAELLLRLPLKAHPPWPPPAPWPEVVPGLGTGARWRRAGSPEQPRCRLLAKGCACAGTCSGGGGAPVHPPFAPRRLQDWGVLAMELRGLVGCIGQVRVPSVIAPWHRGHPKRALARFFQGNPRRALPPHMSFT